MSKRRKKEQIEKDNINYLLSRNRKSIQKALETYDKYINDENRRNSFLMQKVELEGGRFSFDNKSYSEVLTELTRVNDFNSNSSRKLNNAKEMEAEFIEIFKKGNWVKGEKGSIHLLNDDASKRAFRAYRNIESRRANEMVGTGGYGSDNFISYLYAIELQKNNLYDEEDDQPLSQIYGEELLDNFEKSQRPEFNEDFESLIFIPRNVTKESLRFNRKKKRKDLYDTDF